MSCVYTEFHLQLKLHSCAKGTGVRYLICVRRFANTIGLPFEEIQHTHVRRYLVDLLEKEHFGPANYKMHLVAIKFLFRNVLHRPEVVEHFPLPKVPVPVRHILTGAQVRDLLNAISNPMHRAIVTLAYGGGLRISEACGLRLSQIDSKRKLLDLTGKGKKQRLVMLSPTTLQLLRAYWRDYRPPTDVVFPGKVPLRDRPIQHETVRVSLREAVSSLGWNFKVTPHLLRHSFASHIHRMGTDIKAIQQLLGHSSIRTTARYIHLTPSEIANTTSPLELLGTPDEDILT